ncbi:MAG: hypothetical protein AAF198_13245 [Pseudomonadota bacterium]
MARLLKYLTYLAVFLAAGLAGYSFFGDLGAPSEEIRYEIDVPDAS